MRAADARRIPIHTRESEDIRGNPLYVYVIIAHQLNGGRNVRPRVCPAIQACNP